MRLSVRLAAWLLPAIMPSAGLRAAPPPLPRAELPIHEVDLSDGTRRYTVPVTIGGVTMAAGLDTGSTGLRVLSPRLPDGPRGGAATHYSYSSGVRIEGRLNRIPAGLGAIAGQVPVQLIDKIGCMPDAPHCPGGALAMADYGIQGDGLKGEGFGAILGINMADQSVGNPLIALGVTRWIVELPRPGETGAGQLILNPGEEEVASFTRLPLIPALAARTGGVHDSVPGCVVPAQGGEKLCGPVLFDSGAPGLRFSIPAFKRPWPQDTPGQLMLGGGGQTIGVAFAAGRRDQATGMFAERTEAVPHISAGIMPYFAWDVLYDAKAQGIGLKPR